MMRRSVRWTLVLAILGFILGLGFLVPLPHEESRNPASLYDDSVVFIPGGNLPDLLPAPTSDGSADPRRDVLFDVHTISRSVYAKNIDAYVVTQFVDSSRQEVDRFTYCDNYDYSKQRARTNTDRYDPTAQGFTCYKILLTELAAGYPLIETPMGRVLSLKSAPGFDPRRGGTISIEFAYRISKLGKNDYRSLNLVFVLENGIVQVGGPKVEFFNWLELKMSEDIFNLPNGIHSFEFFDRNKSMGKYPAKGFQKVKTP